jgi:molybdenum cofactor synthesis domain-containing protein
MPSAAIITVSDSRAAGAAKDQSGPAVAAALGALGVDVTEQLVVPDDRATISDAVARRIARYDLIITTGGTGVGHRDVTPEAVRPLWHRELPGFGEIMRTGTFVKTPLSIISRGGAGVAGKTLIVMLPGSPRGVTDCMEVIGPAIKHALQVLSRQSVDCQAEANRTT